MIQKALNDVQDLSLHTLEGPGKEQTRKTDGQKDGRTDRQTDGQTRPILKDTVCVQKYTSRTTHHDARNIKKGGYIDTGDSVGWNEYHTKWAIF